MHNQHNDDALITFCGFNGLAGVHSQHNDNALITFVDLTVWQVCTNHTASVIDSRCVALQKAFKGWRGKGERANAD